MNINTLLLIILILVIISPKLRKNLNKIVTRLPFYLIKLLKWALYFFIAAGVVFLIYFLWRSIVSLYLQYPVHFVAYAVIIPIVIIVYSSIKESRKDANKKHVQTKLPMQENGFKKQAMGQKVFIWVLIIFSIAMGAMALFAYFGLIK